MQVHKLEVLVIDHDQLGAEGVRQALEAQDFPNDCIHPSVMDMQTREIGEWSDEHPLNSRTTRREEFDRLFPVSALGCVPPKDREWVTCPVCGEPDMRKEYYGTERQPLIYCVNHGCGSNGGNNFSAVMSAIQFMEAVRQLTEIANMLAKEGVETRPHHALASVRAYVAEVDSFKQENETRITQLQQRVSQLTQEKEELEAASVAREAFDQALKQRDEQWNLACAGEQAIEEIRAIHATWQVHDPETTPSETFMEQVAGVVERFQKGNINSQVRSVLIDEALTALKAARPLFGMDTQIFKQVSDAIEHLEKNQPGVVLNADRLIQFFKGMDQATFHHLLDKMRFGHWGVVKQLLSETELPKPVSISTRESRERMLRSMEKWGEAMSQEPPVEKEKEMKERREQVSKRIQLELARLEMLRCLACIEHENLMAAREQDMGGWQSNHTEAVHDHLQSFENAKKTVEKLGEEVLLVRHGNVINMEEFRAWL